MRSEQAVRSGCPFPADDTERYAFADKPIGLTPHSGV